LGLDTVLLLTSYNIFLLNYVLVATESIKNYKIHIISNSITMQIYTFKINGENIKDNEKSIVNYE